MGANKRSTTLIVALAVGVSALVPTISARAEGGLTLEERVERLERKGELPAKECCDTSDLQTRLDQIEAHIKNLPFGIKVGGLLIASYLYDLNSPQSDLVSLRSFDRDHNTFSLDLFQLQVSRPPGEDGVGFLTKVNFGKVAERMAADWDGDGTIGNVAEEQNSIELEEAYVTYNPPGLPDFQLKAGKFVTLLGSEVIESPSNFNVSHSLAFSWSIPFTHTGVLASYAFTPQVSLTGGIVNGWDNVIDSNDGKTFLGSLVLTPIDPVSFAINGTYGAEQPNRGDSKRGIIDLVATIKPVDNLTLSLNYDYGSETDLFADSNKLAEWNAFSGVVDYEIPDVFPLPVGFALRGEYFDDSKGSRLPVGDPATPGGFLPAPTGHDQNVWEVTATAKLVLAQGLWARFEYRYDSAKLATFERNVGGLQDDQQTLAAELSYVF